MSKLLKDTTRLTDAQRFLVTKLVLFLAVKPFCSIKDIQENNDGIITRNWEDVNSALIKLVEEKLVYRVIHDGIWKYFSYHLLDYLAQKQQAHVLMLRHEVFSMLDNNKKIQDCAFYQRFKKHYEISEIVKIPQSRFKRNPPRYTHGINHDTNLREQILAKFLNLFFLKEKTRIYEMKKISGKDEFYVNGKKSGYETESFEILVELKHFLENYDNPPNTWHASLPDVKLLVRRLDFEYDCDLAYYKNLRNGRRWIEKVIIAQACEFKTRKTVSEDKGITMKRLRDIIDSLKKKDGEYDYARINYLLNKEDGSSKTFPSQYLAEFMLTRGDEARRLLNENVSEKKSMKK